MKRTVTTTLVLGGLLFVILTALLGRQRQVLVWEEARAAETPPPVSVPGEQGGAVAASPSIPGLLAELPVPSVVEAPAKRLPQSKGSVGRMTTGIPSIHDPADVAMDREAKQLALRVRAAKEPEQSKLRAELEKLTEKHFELRQQRRAAEIAELASRVEKLRVAHQRRQENKPDILKRRLADLLDEDNELKWDDVRIKPTLPAPGMDPFSQTPSIQGPQPKLPNLDGEWLVTLPAGFEFVGKIEKQPEGCWSFQEMRNLSGFYQIEGNTLKGVTTDKKEPRDYEWLILNDNVLVLTKAPQNIGSDYRGATLRRGAISNLPRLRSERSANPDGINDRIWNLLGIKLATLDPNEKLPDNAESFQGGLRITEVQPNSPAATNGIRQGDILVGLHVWETQSFENVRYVIENPELREADSIKFTVLRGSVGKLFGIVPWKHTGAFSSEVPVFGVPARLRP